MNAFAADDFEAADVEAADLLAVARLDDDGAPCPCGPPHSEPGRPSPDNDRSAAACHGSAAAADGPARRQRRARRGRFSRPAPAGACDRVRTITAAPGLSRRPLTPALMGVG
jgi:hypothetical protein